MNLEIQLVLRDVDRLGTKNLLRLCQDLGLLNSFREVYLGMWRLGIPSGDSFVAEQKYVRFYAKGLIHSALKYNSEAVIAHLRTIQ